MTPRWFPPICFAMVCVFATPALSQVDPCPNQPVTNVVKQKYSGDFIVGFLKSVIGNLGLSGAVELTPEDALAKYPEARLLYMQVSVLRIVCEDTMTDPGLTRAQRRDELMKWIIQLNLVNSNPRGGMLLRDGVRQVAYRVDPDRSDSRVALDVKAPRDLQYILLNLPAKTQWLKDYYRVGPDGSYKREKECGGDWCYNIIVGTARGQADANKLIDDLNRAYPALAFQLWSTQRQDMYAAVVAIGLPRDEAVALTARLRNEHPDLDAKFWRWPKFAAGYDIAWPW